MSDLLNETLISFAAVGDRIPGRNGRRLNPTTPWRWATKGARTPTGGVVRLEVVRCGGRTLTSVEAVRRFLDRLTAATVGEETAPAVRTPAERRRASERAEAELKKLGA
jgi:hypothetical protein